LTRQIFVWLGSALVGIASAFLLFGAFMRWSMAHSGPEYEGQILGTHSGNGGLLALGAFILAIFAAFRSKQRAGILLVVAALALSAASFFILTLGVLE
jgi:hypothetical protein